MAEAERRSTGYVPRPQQAELHARMRRFNVLVCHRRFGKTVFAVNEMIDRAARFGQTHPGLINPRFAYLAPYRWQAKDIAWDYFKWYTQIFPGVEVNESELKIKIPRPALKDHVLFQLVGAENPMALKGRYLDGGILDEYGEMYPAAWREAIRPTLIDRKGWAVFIGTPKGENNFKELYDYANESGDPAWMSGMFKASETGLIPEEELAALKREMSEEEYEQEMECSFMAALVGAYFGKAMSQAEKTSRITQVPHDEALRVDTFWDIGMNDVTSIWFVQHHYGTWRVIEYLEAPDTGLPEWVRILKKKKYLYGKHHFPHDMTVREWGTGKARIAVAEELLGRQNVEIIPRIEDKLDSINAARLMISKCVFDAEKCKRGIDALKNYQRKWDSKANVFSPKPLHNWASNAADAFQGFAMGAREDIDYHQSRPFQQEADASWDPIGPKRFG